MLGKRMPIDGNGGDVLIVRVVAALVRVPLPFDVGFAFLMFLEEFILLHLILSLIVRFPIITTIIWAFSDIMTGLTAIVANPLVVRFVFLSLFSCCLEGNDLRLGVRDITQRRGWCGSCDLCCLRCGGRFLNPCQHSIQQWLGW